MFLTYLRSRMSLSIGFQSDETGYRACTVALSSWLRSRSLRAARFAMAPSSESLLPSSLTAFADSVPLQSFIMKNFSPDVYAHPLVRRRRRDVCEFHKLGPAQWQFMRLRSGGRNSRPRANIGSRPT